MDEKLKERLVGASVLVALAVIFVPLLLSPSHDEQPPAPPVGPAPSMRTATSTTLTLPPARAGGRVSVASAGSQDASSGPRSASGGPTTAPQPGAARATSPPSGAAPGAQAAPQTRVVAGSGSATKETKQRARSPKPKPAPRAQVAASKRAPESIVVSPDGTGWVVQLASFSKPENARKLRDSLKQRGYPAFVAEAQGGSGKVSRVMVGPVAKRPQAEALVDPLEAASRLRGIVVRR